MTDWNEPIPDKSIPEDHAKARASYHNLDRRGKILADLRALADAPGTAATIASIAADELELAWSLGEVATTETVDAAVAAAFAELQRQLPRAIDLSANGTSVLPFDGFDLRAVIEAALTRQIQR